MKQFLKRSWFLVSLVILMVVGFALPRPFRTVVEVDGLRWWIVAATMFLMTLPVSFSSLVSSAGRVPAILLALLFNVIVIPLLAWPASFFLDSELGYGLIVAAAAPCTLVSAAVWTRRAGGNDTIAIIVTLITNLFCFVITPFWAFQLIGQSMPEIDFGETVFKLLLLVVLPMVVGQIVRLGKPVGDWAGRNKPRIGIVTQIGILSIVFIGSVATGLRFESPEANNVGIGSYVLLLLLTVGIHMVALFGAFLSARALGMSKPDQIAIAFAGSQKTLMVGLSVATELQVSIVPIVIFHSAQLIFDTFVADRFAKSNDPVEGRAQSRLET